MMGYAGFRRHHHHYAGDAAAVVAAEEKLERKERQEKADAVAMSEMYGAAVNKGAAVVTAGAMGMLQGQRGSIPKVLGLEADLVVGLAASAVGLLGHKIPKLKSQKLVLDAIDGVGTGSLAFYAANWGNAAGMVKRQKSAAASAPAADTKAKGFEGYDPRQFAPHFDSTPAVDSESSSSVPYGYR